MNPLPTAPRCFGTVWERIYFINVILDFIGFILFSIDTTSQQWGAPYNHKKGNYDLTKHKVVPPLDLCPAKRLKIKVKRVWRRTHLTLHYSIYCSKSTMLIESKKDYFCLKSCGKKENFFSKMVIFETSVIFTKLNSRCMRSCFFYNILIFLNREDKTWKFI